MRDRMTGTYKEKEKLELKSYTKMPSPRSSYWLAYIEHRMTMFVDGMKVYARRKYKWLDFDNYVEKTRRMDEMAKFLTKNQPSLVLPGDGDMHHAAPIGVRRTLRPPHSRKLEASIKKLRHSDILRTPEPYTSQTCPNCLERFPAGSKNKRTKTCLNCRRNALFKLRDIDDEEKKKKLLDLYELPPMIVTNKTKRRKKIDRAVQRAINFNILDPATIGDTEFQPGRLESKKMYFEKKWPLTPLLDKFPNDAPVDILDRTAWNDYICSLENWNELGDEIVQQNWDIYETFYSLCKNQLNENFKIIWHRDIAAARCILYVGE